MASKLKTIADGIASLLAAGSFSESISASATYDAEWELTEAEAARVAVDGVRVDVVAAADTMEIESRGSIRKQPAFDIIVRRKFGPADYSDGRVMDAKVDALVELLEEITEHLAVRGNRRIGAAVWVQSEIRALWVAENLREWGQYTGVARVTYRLGVRSDGDN